EAAINDVKNPALEGTYEVQGVKCTTAWTLFKNHMAQYTPEWAEKITGVPVADIVELAHMYACETPSTIYAGYHLYDNCEVLGMTWGCLAALTGNIGKRGASIGHLGKNKPYLNQAAMLFPAGLAGLSDDIPWLALGEILDTGKYKGQDYPCRLLYNVGANPVGSYAAQKNIIDNMLPKIPCSITNDLEFSDTVRYSDIVLPCTHYFEYEWIQGASHVPFIYMANKVVEPIGEAMEDTDIFRAISKYLGNPACDKFYAMTNEEMERKVVDTAAGQAMQPVAISYDNLKKYGALADRVENWIHWEEQRFPTESGRLEIYVENPGPRINIIAGNDQIDKNFYHMPTYHTPNEAYEGSEQSKKYPLYHYCERVRFHMHTQFNYSPTLRELDPEPYLRMCTKDADARGLKDGDIIEAYNDRGHCVCRLRIDEGLRPGMVSSPKGWPRDLYIAGSYQELTNDHLNMMHMNTSFDDTMVEVRKWEGEVK
ncbi:MAG: molybdopterin-dependent oxidoreductase, partial [Eggerthellaceae bacterium]|nr:molybdopterin-dependent oxidoreductase [Eggerthellaceae bacterium]